jgi:type VI secretion system protein ImpL
MAIILVAGILAIYLVLAWFAGTWLHLVGSSLWGLRAALAVVGLAGAAFFLWWYYKVFRRSAPVSPEAAAARAELDVMIREALNRVRSGQQGLNLKQLPLIYVLGPGGATKTTTIVSSGLEPELLAGQVYRDNNVVPTRLVNLWYSRQALLVEAAGGVLEQPPLWIHLLRRLQPAKLSSALSKGGEAPRAVLVCFDCEAFLKPGASEAVPAAARSLNARLREISQELGIGFPVYVLFTKLDRISFFADYVRNLTKEEGAQALGVTLPLHAASRGVYAEEESKRLTKAADDVFYGLCGKRLDLLARENEPQNLAGIYEFPREWRKLRTLLVQFLVDLGRPSQLQSNPFVRGFYFSGVRATLVEDAAQAAVPLAGASAPREEFGGGATRIFSLEQMRAAAQAPAPVRAAGQKKVPQWVFLTQLFNEVIARDRAAMGASGFSAKVSFARRLLLAGAALVCLALAVGFTVSYFGNRGLEADASAAAAQLQSVQVPPGQLPAADDLKKLDALRQVLATLDQYRREGAPWSLRWGLYAGDAIYPDVRRVYFADFQQMMFGATQQALLAHLQKLPPAPAPTDNYGFTYDTLKAYLITTSNHDKSTQAFLPPVLQDRWLAGRELDPERAGLARTQFEFYAGQLAVDNPYSSENDGAAVERARAYLSKFAAVERIYRSLLDEADRKYPAIQFNRQFPGSAEAVVDSKDVEGAFSKDGFAFVQDAIAHSDRFFAGEEWVLGKQSYGAFDRAAVEQELRTRYRNDFLEQWRGYLRAAAVLRYSGPADAARKLNLLSSNSSPLLALFALASGNTAVADGDIAGAFQPVQAVVAPNANPFIGPGNQPYMNGLTSLLTAVDQLAKSPGGMNDQAAVGQVRSVAMTALGSAKQVEQAFKVDQAGHVDSLSAALLEAPIKAVDGILRPPGLDGGAVKALCGRFAEVAGKFPFRAQSKTPATLAEVNALFQPNSGALWLFYEQNLKSLVLKQGTDYVVNPAGGARISPAFLSFFNRAAQFSDTVYPGGSAAPQLHFTLHPYPVPGMQELTFAMNGQTLAASGAPKQFTWSGGDTGQVSVTGKMGGAELGILNYSGTWAVFQFFSEADRWQNSGNVQVVEWVPKSGLSGQPMMIGGKPLTLRYDLELAGAPVFNKNFLAGLHCSAN